MTETERALAGFVALRKHADNGGAPTVGVDEPLLDGILDSLGILQLAMFIDERFAVRVQDVDLVPENFATIRSIATYIELHRGR